VALNLLEIYGGLCVCSRYVDHLANTLKQKLDVADKMVASQKAVRQRSIEAGAEAKSLEPKLKMIIAKTKELQGEVSRGRSEVLR
jgi:hypothetical protein